MTDSSTESILTTTTNLLTYYCHEVGSQGQASLLDHWLGDYSPEWVRLALIESLYRGRYKTISVGGLLADWKRKGQPIYHFNREFEALICHKFPQIQFNQEDTFSEAQARTLPMTLKMSREQNFKAFATASTGEVLEILTPQAEESSTELNSKVVDSETNSSGNGEKTLLSNKLWSFVAEMVDNETFSPRSKEYFYPPNPHHNLDASSQSLSKDKQPLKSEVAPIDQFIPSREASDLYQKLVKIVSNRSPSYPQKSSIV